MNELRLLLPVLLCLAAGCHRPTPVDEISVSAATAAEAAPVADFTDEDWPWWRGPTRDGVAPTAAPVEWSESHNVVWKSEVPGRGHSSPTVIGDRVFLATADESDQTQAVIAFDRDSGEPLWETQLNQGAFSSAVHQKSTHANGTVACDGERLFIAFLHHEAVTAYALDLEGNIVWERELGPFQSQFGYAPSPVIHDALVIVAADHRGGGYLAACHRETGEIVWRKPRPAVPTYSSPIVANVAGRAQLFISGCDMVASYDPQTGEPFWTCPGTTEATCGTVVWDGERVFASGGYPGRQTICIDAAGGEEVWSNEKKCYEQSMLVHEGHLYAVDDGGVAWCWDAQTGEERWRERLGGDVSASPVLAGGTIYASNEAGTTFVFKADPSGFQLVAENQLGDEAFATPTICGGRIYLRVSDRGRGVLYCIGEETSAVAARTD